MNALPQLRYPPSLYDELSDLPEGMVGEIFGGRLYTQPRPSGRHGLAGSGLHLDIGWPFGMGRNGGPGGWWILEEPEVHLVRDQVVLVPDLAGWLKTRMPRVPQDHRFEVVPDWVCEILSPATARKDRVQKIPLYARFGVAHCWLVDPLAHTLEAFELHEGRWLLIATLEEGQMVRVPPFDAIEFPLSDLWGDEPAA